MMQTIMAKAVAKRLPGLYETDGQGEKAVAKFHWFTGSQDWFATE